MDKRELKAHENHASTLAILVIVGGGVVLYFLYEMINEMRQGALKSVLEGAWYIVAFFAFMAIGPIKDWFLDRLRKNAERTRQE